MTTPTPVLKYPVGAVTPVGQYHILNDKITQVSYVSYDQTSIFHLMGGASIPDRTTPESIRLIGIKGVIAPWSNISQKGATQDGATYIQTLYDPLDIELTVMARGRDPEHTRQVISDWIAAWAAKRPGQLLWYTHSAGSWWANVRWDQAATDPIENIPTLRQKFTWKAKAYDGFWKSYDDVAVFTNNAAGHGSGGFVSDFTSTAGGVIM